MMRHAQSAATPASPFLNAFRGGFINILRWEQLDALWATLRNGPGNQPGNGWYLYAVGETPPDMPVSPAALDTFLIEIDLLLRQEHDEDYCGIVYVDDRDDPAFVKIYDPNNLGSVCGSSGAPPPLPGWILSRLPPEDLPAAFPPPGNRRRWWRRLFSGE